MLPEDVRRVAVAAMEATAHYSKFLLNVCFPFVSRLEMARAAEMYRERVRSLTMARFGDEAVYRSCLDTFDSPDIDILVRTSGERRLSEFLLHQLCVSGNCLYEFVPAYWPDFSFPGFAIILLRFQNRFSGRVTKHDGRLPKALLARRLKTTIPGQGGSVDGEVAGR
jgi:ditrans,polycis-polyprenyl diphosphate synthase